MLSHLSSVKMFAHSLHVDNALREYVVVQIRARRTDNLRRIGEVALIVSFTVGAIFVLASSLGTCVDVPSWKEKNYGFTFHCPNGEAANLS